jgi:hypothetical protein
MSLGLMRYAVALRAISYRHRTSYYFAGPIAIGSRRVVWPDAIGHFLATNLPATMGIIFCGTDFDGFAFYFSHG